MILVYLSVIKRWSPLTWLIRAKYFFGDVTEKFDPILCFYQKKNNKRIHVFSLKLIFCEKKKRSLSSHASIRQHIVRRINLMRVRLTRTSLDQLDQFDLQTDKFMQTHTLRRIYTHALSHSQIDSPFLQRYVYSHFHRAFYSLWCEHLHRAIKPA